MMHATNKFDFRVDKAAKKVYITSSFAAPIALVWDAFTKAAFLDKWVAPAPYTAVTKYMQFEVGGKRLYAIVSPTGEEKWAIQTYTSITPRKDFTLYNAFSDSDGHPAPEGSDWTHQFTEDATGTNVYIEVYNASFERMESLLEGFKLGYTACLAQLDTLLQQIQTI